MEYWAHVQALMPVELWPVMQHRMEHYRAQRGKWLKADDDTVVERVLAQIADRGASTARDLDDGAPRSKEHWGWNWSEARKALDYLYMVGDLAIAGRTSQFEVRYDLPERVLPPDVLAMPTPSREEADLELVRRAARSHGVASLRCLADYYRTLQAPAKVAVDRLVEEGELLPVRVEGWSRPVWLHRDARRPRRVEARAFLSPFDPVVWLRDRTEALFDFHYRIEIYTPPEQRVHGYYVLPFLLRDEVVGRADLKADRATGRLLVQSAWAEDGAPEDTAAEMAAELRELAAWLGLDDVVVAAKGDLAPELAPLLR